MKSRQAKLDAAFDQLLRAIPKKPLLNYQNKFPINISTTESSDDFESPMPVRKDNLFLFSTPPAEECKGLFSSPDLFSDKLAFEKEKKVQIKRTKNCKKSDGLKKHILAKKESRKKKTQKPQPVDKTYCNQEAKNITLSKKPLQARKRQALALKDPNSLLYTPSAKERKNVQTNCQKMPSNKLQSSKIPNILCFNENNVSVDLFHSAKESICKSNENNENILSPVLSYSPSPETSSVQYVTSTPVVPKPVLSIEKSELASGCILSSSPCSRISQDFRKSRQILNSTCKFLAQLNKRKQNSPQICKNFPLSNVTYRKRPKLCNTDDFVNDRTCNTSKNNMYSCVNVRDNTSPSNSSDVSSPECVIPNSSNNQDIIPSILTGDSEKKEVDKLALRCIVKVCRLSPSDIPHIINSPNEKNFSVLDGNKVAAEETTQKSLDMDKNARKKNHNSSNHILKKHSFTKLKRHSQKSLITPPKNETEESTHLDNSLLGKFRQTCLPFDTDQSPIPTVQRTPMNCVFSQNNRKKKSRTKSDSNSDTTIVSSSNNLHISQSTKKFRQTILDMFFSSGSEFSGFSDVQLSPNRSVQNKTEQRNHRENKISLSNVSTANCQSFLQSCIKSHTNSMIDCFLDLSVSGSSSRRTIIPDYNISVQPSVIEYKSNVPHLIINRSPQVVLRRLDETLYKASLLGTLTAKTKVMCLCNQTTPVTFTTAIPKQALGTARKIGEGSYGEVFQMSHPDGISVAVKIIPIEGEQDVNGGPQMSFRDVLSEVILSKKLNDLSQGETYQTSNFICLHSVSCVKGKYPKKLLSEWKEFERLRGTENDNPSIFQSDQLYIIFQFSFGGIDLEMLQLQSEAEAESIFSQVACSLAVAEGALEFEHRDLHWGNILVSPTSQGSAEYILNGQPLTVKTSGVSVALIDFTLSRMTSDGATVYNDISKDPTLFHGKGDIQFDVYRNMKKHTKNHWEGFHPSTNVLWLEYLVKKLLEKLSSPKGRLRNDRLKKWLRILKKCKSSQDFVIQEFSIKS